MSEGSETAAEQEDNHLSALMPEDSPALEEVLSIEPSSDRLERIASIVDIDVPGASEEVRNWILKEEVKTLSVIYNQILTGVGFTEDDVDGLLRNSIDTHVHGGSDPFERLMSEDAIGMDFTDAGARAMVVKTWYTPSASRNALIQRRVDEYAERHELRGTRCLGGITLSYSVGGFNVEAVKKCLGFPGMKYVWMPMVDSYHHRRVVYDDWSGYGLQYTNDRMQIIDEVKEILAIIADHDLVLATGHYGYEDSAALIEEARARGVTRIELVHPTVVHSGRHSIEQLREQVARGARVMLLGKGLLTFPLYNPPFFTARMIKEIGAEHFVFGSDFGQIQHLPHVVANRWAIKVLLANGVTHEEVRTIFQDAPAEHLGLPPLSPEEAEKIPYKSRTGFGSSREGP